MIVADEKERLTPNTLVLEFLHRHFEATGDTFLLRQIPVTFNATLGRVTWAMPYGRDASEYLAEGISASHGIDVKGPTVALASIARARNRSFARRVAT